MLKVKPVNTLCRPKVDSPPSDAFQNMFIAHMKDILHLIQITGLLSQNTVWPKLDNSIEVNVPRPIQVF